MLIKFANVCKFIKLRLACRCRECGVCWPWPLPLLEVANETVYHRVNSLGDIGDAVISSASRLVAMNKLVLWEQIAIGDGSTHSFHTRNSHREPQSQDDIIPELHIATSTMHAPPTDGLHQGAPSSRPRSTTCYLQARRSISRTSMANMRGGVVKSLNHGGDTTASAQ